MDKSSIQAKRKEVQARSAEVKVCGLKQKLLEAFFSRLEQTNEDDRQDAAWILIDWTKWLMDFTAGFQRFVILNIIIILCNI